MRFREDNPSGLIHGLELQGRALAPVVSDTDRVSFLVGTQSLRHPNMVYRLVMDEESGQLNKRQYRHTKGEVWHIDSCPSDPGLFLSTFGEREGPSGWRKSAAIMRLPETEAGEEEDMREVEVVTELDSVMETGKEVSSVMWQPSDSSRLLCLQDDHVTMIDTAEAGPKVLWSSVHSVRGQTRLETGRWNPHRSYHQLATVSGSQVVGWDTRTGDQAWSLHSPGTSSASLRSLDFNPNKQYYLLTGGDDGCINIWDIRRGGQVLHSSRHHSHWVWSARYNSYHDQLLLSAGSDTRVVMASLATLSSEPYGALVDDTEEAEVSKKQLEDGLVSVWTEHEDSVYTAEWSTADPWAFASLSYDGRLVIGQVPQSVKLNILSLI